MDVNELLDETVEKSVDLDGWISRKASLKIQKATGKNLPAFVKKNMEGMTEEQRNEYRKKIIARRAVKAKLKKLKEDAQNEMKQAVIQRKIRNANLLESFKERKRAETMKSIVAKEKALINKSIAKRNMQEQKALAVRNATNPGVIMEQAEKQRVMVGRLRSNKIMNNGEDIFRMAVQPTSEAPTSGEPRQWCAYLRYILINKGKNSDEFRQAILGIPQDVIAKMSERKQKIITKLKSKFSNPKMAGIGGIGEMTSIQKENLKATVKRDFLETVARARVVSNPGDKMNIMRKFWDRWQPVLSNKPEIYQWFSNDQHVRNAYVDFKGLGEWDSFTQTEAKYLQGMTRNEKTFLGDNRPGVVDAQVSLHPIAEHDAWFDVEDLMPNVPAPQPNLDSVDFGFNGTEPFNNRFDVESLMPGVPNIQPRGVKIKNGKNAGRKIKKHGMKPVGGRINKFIGKMKRRR